MAVPRCKVPRVSAAQVADDALFAAHGCASQPQTGPPNTAVDVLEATTGEFHEQHVDAVTIHHHDDFAKMMDSWKHQTDPLERQKIMDIVGRYWRIGFWNQNFIYRQEVGDHSRELFLYRCPALQGWVVSSMVADKPDDPYIWAWMDMRPSHAMMHWPMFINLPYWEKKFNPMVRL